MQYSPNSTWLVTSRLDTTRHVRCVEHVVSSVSSRAVRQARHSQNAWARHVERVVSCRDETSQVEFGLNHLTFMSFDFNKIKGGNMFWGSKQVVKWSIIVCVLTRHIYAVMIADVARLCVTLYYWVFTIFYYSFLLLLYFVYDSIIDK